MMNEAVAADLIHNALFAALTDDEIEFTLDGELLVKVGGRGFEPTVARIMRGAERVFNGKVAGIKVRNVENALLSEEQASTVALGLLLAGMRRDRAAVEVLASL